MRDRREGAPAGRGAALDMDPETFRRLGHRLVDALAEWLATMPAGPVTRDVPPSTLRSLLPRGGPPEQGSDPEALLAEVAPLLFRHSLFNGHPDFFGYITSSAAPIGALADLLAASINANLGGWQLSPLASEIEGQCVRWIAALLGMPEGSGGALVSGGNVANFTGFLAARRHRAPEQIRSTGLAAAGGRLLVYATAETHTWIDKATDLFGLGTDSIRQVPVDGALRADPVALRGMIEADRAAGHRPFLVVGNAGTVSTGAVDPLAAMADVAAEHGLWFHLDGAYGAPGVLSDDAPPDLAAGLARADSVAVDPHKWLYAPIEAGCILVRDARALERTFGYTPPYYRFTGEEDEPRTNYYAVGLQNTRGFRALKVWLGLRQAGVAGYRQMIGDDVRLARELFAALAAHPETEARSCNLSIVTFRYVPPDLRARGPEAEAYLDELNERLLARLKAGGEAFVSNVVTGGRFLLRACIVNFRTTLENVRRLPRTIARYGAAVDRELRPPGLRG